VKSTVRKEESGGFGKDYGLIHEAIITGKKVGAGKDFWSALAHNKDLFEKTRAFVESGGVTSTGELITLKSFPTWRTITLGTHKDTKALFKALENAGVNIGDYARFMMKHSMFSIATTETEINLVKVTVAELGFPNSATRAQIYEAALKQGLFLCPAEVGPQVRLQYLDQPRGDWFRIGMEPIPDSGGDPNVFDVGHDDAGRWLNSNWYRPDNVWDASCAWVFCRPRK